MSTNRNLLWDIITEFQESYPLYISKRNATALYNALYRAGFKTIEAVRNMTEEDIIQVRYLGDKRKECLLFILDNLYKSKERVKVRIRKVKS